MIHGQKNIKK